MPTSLQWGTNLPDAVWVATQWIPADAARALAKGSFALSIRAHAGLVQARAFLLIAGEKSLGVAEVPAKFWWAEGHDALQQNWLAGDFGTWIDGEHWQAFGVTFALEGLLDMIDFERRPLVRHSWSVASNPDWVTAQDARAFVYNEIGAQPALAGAILLDKCRLGFVASRAVLAQHSTNADSGRWQLEEREWDVPLWFWERFTVNGSSSQDWERGVFSGSGVIPMVGRASITLTDVRFSRVSIESLRPAVQNTPSVEVAPARTGGRPPAAFWDDLWCSVWGDIYRGDLKPSRQADIERAMLNWASDKGHELAETTAKQRARRLFDEIQAEGRNP